MALINIEQTRPGMSMTENTILVIDILGRVCNLISNDVKYRHPRRRRLRRQLARGLPFQYISVNL